MINDVDRFKQKVDRSSNCHIWTAGKDKDGYGVFWYNNRKGSRAHRFALELKLGRSIRKGYQACHTCHNPSCVNPDHLYEGTTKTNRSDQKKAGRILSGLAASHSAKLTEMQVEFVRAWYFLGFKQSEIAAVFGITQSQVSRIANSKSFAWVK